MPRRRASGLHFLGFAWPALAAASVAEVSSAWARALIDAAAPDERPEATEPAWTTPNRTVLDLQGVRLREFASGDDTPTLICAPYTLHDAMMVDLAPGHSVVAALLDAGLRNVCVTQWRSATPEMCHWTIDEYLSGLNVLIDYLGGHVNLIGVCQGGWLGLIYAARFPAKVRTLTLAGAPVDLDAGESAISRIARSTPPALFRELVALGEGRMMGYRVTQFWTFPHDDPEIIHELLAPDCAIASDEFQALSERFQAWHAWMLDLPGAYYLQAVEQIYRNNEVARGRFKALGMRIDLSAVRIPVFLIAAQDDQVVAPAQLFAATRLLGTPPGSIGQATVKGGHYHLFMNSRVMAETWPAIAGWIKDAA
ncbi:MAG: alpha/beta hydrolase [Pseudorhodoplanes sp.]|nr:alpha/beta hydrolase [Pseudorhodoplanes sp.]